MMTEWKKGDTCWWFVLYEENPLESKTVKGVVTGISANVEAKQVDTPNTWYWYLHKDNLCSTEEQALEKGVQQLQELHERAEEACMHFTNELAVAQEYREICEAEERRIDSLSPKRCATCQHTDPGPMHDMEMYCTVLYPSIGKVFCVPEPDNTVCDHWQKCAESKVCLAVQKGFNSCDSDEWMDHWLAIEELDREKRRQMHTLIAYRILPLPPENEEEAP